MQPIAIKNPNKLNLSYDDFVTHKNLNLIIQHHFKEINVKVITQGQFW